VETLENKRQATRDRLAAWRSSLGGAAAGDARRTQLRPFELRIIRQHEYLQLLKKRLDKMVIRAPAEAYVATIVARQGNVLKPGDPVVVMVEVEPRQVIAYVEEERGYTISVGETALIRPRDRTSDHVEGTVTAIAGTVAQIPVRFCPAPTRPRWGREVFIRIGAGHKLDPGQAVDITFKSNGGAFHIASPVVDRQEASRWTHLEIPK
jgi:hypothetical protein